jgi:hypothetical protein
MVAAESTHHLALQQRSSRDASDGANRCSCVPPEPARARGRLEARTTFVVPTQVRIRNSARVVRDRARSAGASYARAGEAAVAPGRRRFTSIMSFSSCRDGRPEYGCSSVARNVRSEEPAHRGTRCPPQVALPSREGDLAAVAGTAQRRPRLSTAGRLLHPAGVNGPSEGCLNPQAPVEVTVRGSCRPRLLKNSVEVPTVARNLGGGAHDDGKPRRVTGATVLLVQP